MLLPLLALTASAATPFGGLEWRPLSRADLEWVLEERTSGLGVGEFDGTASPALQGFGGAWFGDRVGLSLSLGIARLQNTTEVDEVVRQRHWGVVRPGLDLRLGLTQRVERRPFPWVLVGAHGDIPSSRDISNGYTDAEQAAADEQAYIERARLGGFGGRLGIGAEYELLPGLGIGAQWGVGLHRGTWRAEDLSEVSSWVSGEASLLLLFRWPPRAEPTAPEPDEPAAPDE